MAKLVTAAAATATTLAKPKPTMDR